MDSRRSPEKKGLCREAAGGQRATQLRYRSASVRAGYLAFELDHVTYKTLTKNLFIALERFGHAISRVATLNRNVCPVMVCLGSDFDR